MADSTNPGEVEAATEAPVTIIEEAPPVTESPKAEVEVAPDTVKDNAEEVPASIPVEETCFSPKPSSNEEENPVTVIAEETPTPTPVELTKEPEVPTADPIPVEAAPALEDSEAVSPAPAPEVVPAPAMVNGDISGNDNVAKANGEAETKENTETANVVAPEKPQEKKEEEDSMPPEADSVVVPPHWHAKACLQITSMGGFVPEQELSSLFSEFGKISSIVFENERKDSAIIRYETATAEGEELVAKAKEKLNNAQLGGRTLLIEAFRSDSLLFIGNLTPEIDDDLLRNMFEKHGTIERAFVLRNAAGRSKGYGFVEYSLKSQALNAKVGMGNINMDGRVLRVEWSDCRKIADMFSTVLFVDRIPKANPDVEASLKSLFGQYGKVRDCHLAIGINNMFRGFGFIDFYHSLCADMAHQALDGHSLDGHSIRVSFANPSKSAQSYKTRFGSQSNTAPYGPGGRGSFPGMMGNAPGRGHMPMPMPGQRFMGHGRTGMMGMGIGMQFGRGSHVGQALLDQGLTGSGAGMLGAGATPGGTMGRPPLVNNVPPRRGMAVGATLAPIPRLPGQSSINSATITQVATAQAKARETKARAEEYYQHQPQQTVDNAYQQPYQQAQQPYQQQAQQPYQQQVQQPYQQQTQQQQTALQTQYQQQAAQHAQQPYTQYYAQPAQGYIQSQTHQQTQQGQYPQSAPYYQQQPAQQEQYSQQYGATAQQQYSQPYNQSTAQVNTQQYQQTVQPQVQTQYSQQYNQPAAQSNVPQYLQANAAAPVTNTTGIVAPQSQDVTQQQAYTAYYNQQQQNVAQVASGAAQTSNVVGTSQQSLEAQWAAYYASQAAYQQQTANYSQQQHPQPPAVTSYNEYVATPDVGQKRTADQMEAGSQSQQMAYNYQQQMATSYPQQVSTGAGSYQQNQAMSATAYQQHSAVPLSGYQVQTNAQPYQNQPVATAYQQPVPTTVSTGSTGDGYQQQQPVVAATPFQPTAQVQAVNAAVYDYNKRPRF